MKLLLLLLLLYKVHSHTKAAWIAAGLTRVAINQTPAISHSKPQAQPQAVSHTTSSPLSCHESVGFQCGHQWQKTSWNGILVPSN